MPAQLVGVGNLIKELHSEIERCEALITVYKSIGPTGVFGATAIAATIAYAKTALEEWDTVKLVKALGALRDCE